MSIKLPKLTDFNLDLTISFKEKIILGGIIALVFLIPTGAYVLSLRAKTQSEASTYTTPVTSPKPIKESTESSRLKQALDKLDSRGKAGSEPINVTPTDSDGATLILGPTLGFKLVLEARPASDQSSQVFVGIAEGTSQNKPKYLLSFMIDIPSTGVY